MKTQIFILLLIIACFDLLAQTSNEQLPLTAQEREQFLQQALALRKAEKYSDAIVQLDRILTQQAEDAQILLLKGDIQLQNRDFSGAVLTYQALLPLKFEETISLINLSYALFMSGKPSKALSYAHLAWKNEEANRNAIVNYFNALLWNVKTKEAASFLEEYGAQLRDDQQLVMKARLYTTSGDYKKGLAYYDTLVNEYSNKHYAQEYTEVLLSKKEVRQAERILEESKHLFSEGEYTALNQKAKASKMSQLGTDFVYFKDVGNNTRVENSIWWRQRADRKYRFGLRAGLSTVKSELKEKTQSKNLSLFVQEKWSMAWTGISEINLQKITFNEEDKFTSITGRQLIQYKPTDRQSFAVFFSSEILNYTASLFEKNIRSNNLGYQTHLMFDGKNGFYSQGNWGSISDGNQRFQFFGSLYHLFGTQPLIKSGLNFSVLHFKDKEVTVYFSPDKYLSTEIFLDYNAKIPGLSNVFLNSQVAGGFQNIESTSWDKTFRLQAELVCKTKNVDCLFRYQTSNVASGTGTGYSFDWFTFSLIWKW